MFAVAACEDQLAVTQWLMAHGAVWPASFTVLSELTIRTCWSVSAVQWALARGSGWHEWKCEDYTADKYLHVKDKQQAAELLEWAHANGCPCTCGRVH
jgi:hypothetical protein